MALTKAEKKENAAICKRAKFLRELLAEFGVTLVGFDPGITGSIKDAPPGTRGGGYWGEHLSFDSGEWKWLEPLLMELRELRLSKWR